MVMVDALETDIQNPASRYTNPAKQPSAPKKGSL
jgi:hypothetical protein